MNADGASDGAQATFAARARAHAEQLAPSLRKERGAWFTPPELAEPTADRTLAPLLANGEPPRLRIADPAVGGGAFLLAALRTLVRAGLRPADAAACLHGVDVDSAAATLAAAAVREACGDDAPPAADVGERIHAGDGLVDLDDGTFDAVLTNPPWETLRSTTAARAHTADLRRRFRHQGGGKLFTYRLFVERALGLLRPGGRFGLIVPASLWFDRDAGPLRRLLFDGCAWEWLFGFENRAKVFAIDGRYRFGVIVGTKGGHTTRIKVAFGRVDPREWASPAPPHTECTRDDLVAASPSSGAFVEIGDARDLAVLRRMHDGGVALVGNGGAFAWRQGDFNMTADRGVFVLRSEAEAAGYRRQDDGTWRRGGHDDLLPLLQGAMIGDLHPNAGAHRRGTGHDTTWERPHTVDDVRPAFLVRADAWRDGAVHRPCARIVLRTLSNATNERTAIACLVGDVPCGNSLGVLVPRDAPLPLRAMASGAALLGSLAFDWALRLRLFGINLNGFVLADCVLPRLDDTAATELARLTLRLCALLPSQRSLWQVAGDEGWRPDAGPAHDAADRRELTTRLDLLCGRAFGLGDDEVAWIVRDCDRDTAELRRRDGQRLARGFWRVDRALAPHLRRPQRWLAASRQR